MVCCLNDLPPGGMTTKARRRWRVRPAQMGARMNDLEQYFTDNTGRLIHKWQHYFDVYDRHFARFRGTDVCVLEFGVYQGGSLQMWKDYFGPQAKIYGVDINEHCKVAEEDQVEVIIGDQEDRAFLKSLAESIPRIDILIDDGGHKMRQQIATFEELFPHVQPNGVYLCEDLHTSYWESYGGGYRKPGSFIEYSKDFIDSINAWLADQPDSLKVSEFTRTVTSLHYYDSILVVEKGAHDAPVNMKSGTAEIPDWCPPAAPSEPAPAPTPKRFWRSSKR